MFLLAIGAAFLGLGMLLFFDRALLALGNLLFVAAFPFLIGFQRSVRFFNPIARPQRRAAILFFLGGLLLVILGFTFIGMVLELVGMVALFRSFLGVAVEMGRRLPVLGTLLSFPVVDRVVAFVAQRRLPV